MNIATVFDRVLPAEAVKLPPVNAKEIVEQLLPHLNSYLMVLERPSYPDVLLGFSLTHNQGRSKEFKVGCVQSRFARSSVEAYVPPCLQMLIVHTRPLGLSRAVIYCSEGPVTHLLARWYLVPLLVLM